MSIELNLAAGLLPLRKVCQTESSFQAVLNQDNQD